MKKIVLDIIDQLGLSVENIVAYRTYPDDDRAIGLVDSNGNCLIFDKLTLIRLA